MAITGGNLISRDFRGREKERPWERRWHAGGDLRWLDWISGGEYLPSSSINYVAMSKDMGERLPQLYYIKKKISYDLGFFAIGVAMAT